MGKHEVIAHHGQRGHAWLVNEQAAAVRAPVREDLEVGEIRQSAPCEFLIVAEKAALNFDKETRPGFRATLNLADQSRPFVPARYLISRHFAA
jgi:hypothetical protein